MNIESVLSAGLEWVKTSGPRLVLILVLAWVALKIARVISNRFFATIKKADIDEEEKKRADTLSSLIRHVLSFTITAVATVMLLDLFGIDIGPILAAAGIVGLAVGFGAQNLVKDVIAGFFILMENQIRVGDVVQIAGKGGLVESVNLRMTTLRDLSGSVHYIRNGNIDVVTNMTKEYSFSVFDVGVAYREDIDEVMDLIREVGDQLQQDEETKDDILEPVEILGLDQFADSAIIIKARIKTKPIKQWQVGRQFNRLLKKKFDEKNIEMPFPHITLYMGEDKQGKAAPLNLSIATKQAPTDNQIS
jgi:small conductance mechanosensitive channel